MNPWKCGSISKYNLKFPRIDKREKQSLHIYTDLHENPLSEGRRAITSKKTAFKLICMFVYDDLGIVDVTSAYAF